ncbi:unnamed protein product [Soboliphyme baturini]|uniref:TIL domain-containing protein n=1 Tax=Soboliphyme baturini TaxID=241478 RepID=A0A183J2C6_9BILA|nr:unnamed protein product [Soboliphyme baturini]
MAMLDYGCRIRDPCGKNAHHLQCGSACPKTCENPTGGICSRECVPGCFCKDGFLRNSEGECVRENECYNPCGNNEKYTTCGSMCPKTCDKPTGGPCTRECVPGCFCKDGFVRNKDGYCVKPNECKVFLKQHRLCLASHGPAASPKCGRNEKFTTCGSMCPKTCESIKRPQARPCAAGCLAGCVCKEGYVRKKNGRCVKPRNC